MYTLQHVVWWALGTHVMNTDELLNTIYETNDVLYVD